MDPLSFTTGVLALLGSSISAIQSCQAFAAKYQVAELSISSVRTECSSIRIALLQIQSLISRTPAQDIQDRFQQYVVDEYNAVLGACSLTFALLNERLEGLGLNRPGQRNESEIHAKLRFLWNEVQMDMIRQNIRGQALAISLLVTAFQSETATKSYELLISQQSKAVLESVCHDAKTLREASLGPRSEMLDLNTTGSVIGDEEFSFDDIVINSHAYRRAFLAQQRKLEVPLIQEEAKPQISNPPISGLSKSRNNPSFEKLDKLELGRPAYMNLPGGEKRRDEIRSPERSMPWQNSQFLKRMFGKTSSTNNITTAGADGGKKLPSAKLFTAIKSDSPILRQVQQLEHSWDIWSIALSPDGRLATTGSGGKVLIWETDEQGRLRQVQDLGNYSAYSVAFSPDGRLATAGILREARIWEMDPEGWPQLIQVLRCNLVYISTFATTGSSERALIYEDYHRQPYPTSGQDGYFMCTLAFSSDGRLATFGGKGKVLIWEIGRRRRLQQVQELDCPYVFLAVFSPDGRLATGDMHGNVKIWEVNREGRLQQIQQLESCRVMWSIAFSPDGRLAISGVNGKVQILETDQEGGLQQVQQLESCRKISSIAFSTDGLLAAAGDDGVLIWKADEQRQLQKVQLLAHSNPVWSVVFSPDGRRLAFSDCDGNVLIWEVNQQGRP